MLDEVYVPGSSPWVADRGLLAAYRKQNVRVRGLRIAIERVALVRRTTTSVTLKVTDRLAAGEAVDHVGAVTPMPAGHSSTKLITLTATAGAGGASPQVWRISSVTQG
ncbi:hypothetical protein [Kribbella sp. HUAS MG21]|uniref:Uncharacterized protein n=1 Tax=Kribbella sp. HUAS MG21 TaxID=3160966 RepID=A0AAU7TC22_9ACTN